jgi:hypothetical protein
MRTHRRAQAQAQAPAQAQAAAILFVLLAAATSSLACSTMQKGAAKDPMKCERDPGCSGKQDKSKDCYTSCADDIACVDRCRQVTGQR